MRIKKRFMASFLTLVMLVTALIPNGLVFAADKNLMQETDGFYYTLDYALSEDKTEEVMTLTLQAKENVTIQEVILPDGEVVAYTEQPVTYTVAENGKGNFTVKYIKNEPAEPLETETVTETIAEEVTVTEPQTETSDLAVQETVIPFDVTDIPKVETTEVGSETEKDSTAKTVNLDSSGNVVVTTLDELNATIANSVDGDTITVDGSITGIAVVDGKKITLTGGTLQALNISNGSEVTLQDITIDANEIGNGTAKAGDSAIITNNSYLVLQSGTIIRNAQNDVGRNLGMGGGGGICAENNSNVEMYDGAIITNNVAIAYGSLDGGSGILLDSSELIIYGGKIINNEVTGIGYGGGVLAINSNIKMLDGLIDNNTASSGGGIRLASSKGYFSKGVISNNVSDGLGGGIITDSTGTGKDKSVLVIDGTIQIINNHAGSNGGGIYAAEQVNLLGGIIKNNSSDKGGGGIYYKKHFATTFLNISGSPIVQNNSVNNITNNLEINGANTTVSLVDKFNGTIGITKTPDSPNLPNNTIPVIKSDGYNSSLNMVQSKMGTNANFFSDNPDYITRIEKDGENNKVVLGFPTITYHLRGGDFTDATEKTFYTTGNQPISKPSDPYYLDHAFVNWYSSADTSDSGAIFDFSTPIAKDTDIYARWYPDVYAISFDANGGTGSMDDIEHNGGANAVDLPANTFTKAGHTFTGWNTAADGTGTPVADGVTGYVAGSNNITLYAQWKVDFFDITFDSKGGSAVGNINDVPYGETITAPSSPTNTGYTFDGWYKDEAYTDAWDFSSDTVLTDVTLYAKWTQKEYTVKYDAGFDEFSIADKTGVHYFDTDLVPTPLIKAGYSFGGWKYQDNYLTEATSYADCAKDDTLMEITLVAQWLPIEYTVKYDTKGADTIADKTGVLFDDKNLLPTNPAKTGYNFTGWKLDDVEVTPDMTYSSLVNSDRVMEVTLTAQWELKEYTVKYDTKGADTITDKTGVHFTDKDLLPANPVKAGYTFNGWKLVDTDITADTTYSSLVADDTVMEITLEAQWTAKEYTVKYDTKGADTITDKTGVHFNDKNLLPADPVKAGYTFDGWKLVDTDITADTTYGSLVADDTIMEITLEAQWTAKEYTVIYDTKGADTITDKIGVHFNDKNLLPADPVKAGYTFTGWKLGNADITADTTYSSLVADDTIMEITLAAQWTANSYTVQYDTKGGNLIANKTSILFTDNGLLPADPVKAGYTFDGWKLVDTDVTVDTTYNSLVADDTVMEITLEAQWTAKEYTVKYDAKGADTITDKTGVHFNDKNLLPADPIKAGYTFNSWKLVDTDVTIDTTYSSLVADDTIMEITLEAQWTAKEYTVKYDTKGADAITDKTGVHYTDKNLLPADPVKVGYTFNGWKLVDADITADTAYNSLVADDTVMEITLEAQWTANEYTVKYDTKGADTITDKTGVHFNDKNLLPADPIKAGYTFNGWKLVDTDITADTTYSSLVADGTVMEITLEAQWTAKDYTVKYDTQGADTIADKTGVKYVDASLLPADTITKDGYTFLGWKYEDTVVSDANTYESLAKDDTLPSITLVAEWKENVYKVKYETGFEDVTVADKENVKWNDSNLLSEPPKKDGYGFICWELNDKQVTATDKYSGFTTDQTDGSFITLTAKWTELSDYSVLYNTNGGSMSTDTPSTITGMKYKNTVPTPTPVRDGYTFKGWTYKDSAVQEKSAYSTLAKDDTIKQIELVAQWEENSYTVKYDTKGGNTIDNKTDVKFGDNTLLPTKDPVRAGYTFMGWKYEDTTVVDATRYNELVADDTVKSVTLVAQWEINKYTVDFSFTSDKNPDGITVPKEVTVAYGGATDEPKFTAPTNWTFDGWYTDKECKQKYDFSTPIKGNMTLFGKWTYKAPETPKTEEPAKPSEPTKPTTPSTPDSGTDAPKTGDDTNLNLFIALFGISAGLLLLLVGKRKKQRDL